MSAPALPVVACVVWNLTTRPDMPLVIADSVHRQLGAHSTDIPALAVPHALWGDNGFCEAVMSRVFGGVAPRTTVCIDEILPAIHAELRARADGAV